jgi:outer membrane immunogenic protein
MRVQSILSVTALSLLGFNIGAPAVAAENVDWQGFYVGMAVGSRMQKSEWEQTKFAEPFMASAVVDATSDGRKTDRDFNAYGGLYGGYNWAIGNKLIAGVEVAGGYADNQSAKNYIDFSRYYAETVSQTAVTVKSDWDVNLRGRLGYLITPSTLLYGAAGLAATRLQSSTNCPSDGIVCNPMSPARKDNHSEMMLGWTVGAGVETSLTEHLLARAEYQYTDYGSSSYWAMHRETGQAFGVRNHVDLISQKMTLGLAYRF